MAQPAFTQQEYKPTGRPHNQQWLQRQSFPQDYKLTIDARSKYSSYDATYLQDDLWGGNAMIDNGLALNNSLHMSPHIVPESESSLYANSDLTYPAESVSQGLTVKGSVRFGGQPAWAPSHTMGILYGMNVNDSDPGTNSSYSPRSYVSDALSSVIQPFDPKLVANTASENSWAHYSTLSCSAFISSSPDGAPHVIEDFVKVESSRLPQNGLGITVPPPTPAGPSHRFSGLPNLYDDTSQYDSEYSYSQKDSPGASPWFPEGQSLSMTVMPCRSRDTQACNTPFDGLPNTYQSYNNNSTSCELLTRNRSPTDVSAQKRCQDRFQVHRTVDIQAQRKADDEILLEGKKDGLTYKEIVKKMHTKCAESTLRGRYRSLTKARQDRVRKPVWQEKDVDLLTEFVMHDLDRIDKNHNHSLNYGQRLAKVQWKKVADSIRANGGTYHFGNSTCKRKWQELNTGA